MKENEIVLVKHGCNKILNRPFQQLFEFGRYTQDGCIVYKKK